MLPLKHLRFKVCLLLLEPCRNEARSMVQVDRFVFTYDISLFALLVSILGTSLERHKEHGTIEAQGGKGGVEANERRPNTLYTY